MIFLSFQVMILCLCVSLFHDSILPKLTRLSILCCALSFVAAHFKNKNRELSLKRMSNMRLLVEALPGRFRSSRSAETASFLILYMDFFNYCSRYFIPEMRHLVGILPGRFRSSRSAETALFLILYMDFFQLFFFELFQTGNETTR